MQSQQRLHVTASSGRYPRCTLARQEGAIEPLLAHGQSEPAQSPWWDLPAGWALWVQDSDPPGDGPAHLKGNWALCPLDGSLLQILESWLTLASGKPSCLYLSYPACAGIWLQGSLVHTAAVLPPSRWSSAPPTRAHALTPRTARHCCCGKGCIRISAPDLPTLR